MIEQEESATRRPPRIWTLNIAVSILLLSMLVAIERYMGWRVALLAGIFAAIWFLISMILLARPPRVPEFLPADEAGPDEQMVVSRQVIPRLPLADRYRLSMSLACGVCFLVWMTLGALGK